LNESDTQRLGLPERLGGVPYGSVHCVQYREYAPWPRLASTVHCVWTLEGHARELADVQPILPDGRPEIILHLGDPFDRIEADGSHPRQPATLFAGQLLNPVTLRPTGVVAVVGVRLQPHGAAALLDRPQDDLVGATIGVDALSMALARDLEDVRTRGTSVGTAARAVQQCLLTRIDQSRVDPRVGMAVDHIRDARGMVTVDDLARRVELTGRQLERVFKRTVGVSPKRLARVTRFQRALRILEHLDSPQRGTQTAAMCGYADQAHFIRDFRELAGCPPGAHLMRHAELNGFFARGVAGT
jgi:AraC-like DNA-binding protein